MQDRQWQARAASARLVAEGFWRVVQTPDGEPTRKWIEPRQYKTQPNHVLTGTGEIFHFATPEETPARMAVFVQWLRDELQGASSPLLDLLARLHYDFIRIHPFDDGNGRVVRLMINYVLLRLGLPPLVIKTRQRRRYLEVIAQVDAGNQVPLAAFLGEALGWAQQLALQARSGMVELEIDD